MLKVIVDTNIFVSGLLNSPTNRQIIKALQKSEFTLIISPQILAELIGVISRPKFHNIIVRQTAEKLIEVIKTQSILVKPSQQLTVIEDDPADNRFLEASLEAKTDFIISGDHHLLSLKSFHKVPIITAKDFLTILKK